MTSRDAQGDGAEALDHAIELAARLIALARHVVALVGAGLSAESGVPTFRGPEGLWTKHGEPDLRDFTAAVAHPVPGFEFPDNLLIQSASSKNRRFLPSTRTR